MKVDWCNVVFCFVLGVSFVDGQVSSVTVTPSSPSLNAGGDSLTLTCSATTTAGTPSFSWTGPESRGPIAGTAAQQGSTTFTDTFVLGRVKESHRGTFTCQVLVASTLTAEASVTVAVHVPSISVSITGSGNAVALRNYTLTCSVTAPATLDLTSPSYLWIRNGVMLLGETGKTFIFTPLRTEVNSVYMYTCQYTATSPYLNNNVDVTSPWHRISIIVGTPSAPTRLMGTPLTTSILLTWSQSSLDVVDSYTISYTGMSGCASASSSSLTPMESPTSYNLSSLEEATEYVITIQAKNTAGFSPANNSLVRTTLAAVPSCCVPSPISQSMSLTSITVMWQREDCLLRNGQSRHYSVRYREAGSSTIIATATISVNNTIYTASSLYPHTSYTFQVALVNEVGTGPYTTSNISTSTPTSLGLLLGSVLYPNNSVVTLTDIGEDTAALFCLTDHAACCRGSGSSFAALGGWLLPGGSLVARKSGAVVDNFYRSRGSNTVLLHRGLSTSEPSGVFTCVIPDSQDNLQQVFVGIYLPDAGSPLIESLTYNILSGVLTCESTGGPASNVTWSRTGSPYQHSQRVVDTSTATYHNLLSITSSQLSDYSGSFSCSVSNSRGHSPTTTMTYQSIELSGQQTFYSLESSASVTCFSNLTVLSIQWLNSSNSEALLARGTFGQQELVLDIERITSDINNTRYSCEISIMLPTGTTVVARQSFMLNYYVLSPTSITVTDTTSSGVTVQWKSVGPVDSMHKETCVVMYGTTSGPLDNRSSEVTDGDGRQSYSIPLNSLDPATDYNYVIHCWNEFNSVGITSAEMSFRTSDSESGPVRGLAITSLDDTILVIFWIPPDMHSGFITSFLIKIYDLRERRLVTDDMTSDGEVTSYTASDLVAGVPYNVSVAAVNMAGTGRLRFQVVFTRELKPSLSPKNVSVKRISGSMIRVSWTSMTLSEARGFITHYTVAYLPSTSRSKRQESNTLYQTVRNSSETTIEGLDENIAYAVQVSASTATGAGGYSGAIISPLPSNGGDIEIIAGVIGVTIIVVVVIVVVILVIVFAVKTRKTNRSVSIKTDVPTYNTNKYEDNSLTNCPSDYEIPNRVEEIELKEGPSDYEMPVPSKVEEIKLKESPSDYEILVPTKASLSQQAGYINVNLSSAYGINTTSPNLEFGGQGQEGVEVTPSDGVYETIH